MSMIAPKLVRSPLKRTFCVLIYQLGGTLCGFVTAIRREGDGESPRCRKVCEVDVSVGHEAGWG